MTRGERRGVRGIRTSKPWLYAALGLLDRAGGRLVRPHLRRRTVPFRPRKVLVANIAHLGDVLLSTGVPAALKRLFPGAEIDFLVSSRAAPLLRGHPAVARVHAYDSMLLNWTARPVSRSVRWIRSLAAVLPPLRRERFDLVIELRSYFPNALPLLRLLRPGCLVGFGTGGFRFLLDLEVRRRGDVHEVRRFQDVVDALRGWSGVCTARPARADPDIGYLLRAGAAAAEEVLARLDAGRSEYAVLHPGTRPRKRWPDACWRSVAQQLCRDRWSVIVTGTAAERTWLAGAFEGLPVRLVAGATDIAALAGVFRRASVYVGADSFASHLAALAGTPRVVVLWNRFADPAEWAPLGRGQVLILEPAAAPEQVLSACLAARPSPGSSSSATCWP
ncbi:MAG: glycosyltransferase family 9 protein [Gemmatimonadetes bacterium]|nr:glycosyltransferase family 9 protein [Gemmatimonadota bacterium]